MKNYKILNASNLIDNINYCKNKFNIMAMVKADAYGHGYKSIVKIIDDKVEWYGVANETEALDLRKITDNKILIVGRSRDYKKLIQNSISLTVDTLEEIKEIFCVCAKLKVTANLHIKVNTGMNRLGTKDIKYFKLMINTIQKCKYLNLEGVFTHFFDSDKTNSHFNEQMEVFKDYTNLIQKSKVLIHIGGSFVLNYKIPSFVNFVRVGYFMYGYGNKSLKPVMSVQCEVIKITECKKGEYVGYGNTILKKDSKIALVSFGYADGFCRNLSNKAYVTLNGIQCKVIGKVCMDMFFIDVTNVNVQVGDKVIVFNDAKEVAKIVNTSPYEVLTNFSKTRAKIKIVR